MDKSLPLVHQQLEEACLEAHQQLQVQVYSEGLQNRLLKLRQLQVVACSEQLLLKVRACLVNLHLQEEVYLAQLQQTPALDLVEDPQCLEELRSSLLLHQDHFSTTAQTCLRSLQRTQARKSHNMGEMIAMACMLNQTSLHRLPWVPTWQLKRAHFQK